jgi:hypothetical protein
VDEGVGFLDKHGKAAMYYQVEKRFDLKREEIPKKLEVFGEALDGLFGYGAKIIEFQIIRNLSEKLDLEFEGKQGWTLKDYADHIQKKWQQSQKTHTMLDVTTQMLPVLCGKLLNAVSLAKLLPNCAF